MRISNAMAARRGHCGIARTADEFRAGSIWEGARWKSSVHRRVPGSWIPAESRCRDGGRLEDLVGIPAPRGSAAAGVCRCRAWSGGERCG